MFFKQKEKQSDSIYGKLLGQIHLGEQNDSNYEYIAKIIAQTYDISYVSIVNMIDGQLEIAYTDMHKKFSDVFTKVITERYDVSSGKILQEVGKNNVSLDYESARLRNINTLAIIPLIYKKEIFSFLVLESKTSSKIASLLDDAMLPDLVSVLLKAHSNEQIIKGAMTNDIRTGAKTKNVFDSDMDELCRYTYANRETFTLCYVDFTKIVNETLAKVTEQANRLTLALAKNIQEQSKSSDTLYRFDYGKFIWLVRHSTKEAAKLKLMLLLEQFSLINGVNVAEFEIDFCQFPLDRDNVKDVIEFAMK